MTALEAAIYSFAVIGVGALAMAFYMRWRNQRHRNDHHA